jgi:hypothetical protein
VATRLRRHPFRETPKGLEKWCPGCTRWRLCSLHFSKRRTGDRAGEYLSRCKDCICRPKTKHGSVSGYVPAPQVWWIFDELARRVGVRRSAESLGVSPETVSNILHRHTLRVQRRNVYRAITYLRCLRQDNVWDPPKQGRKASYYEARNRCVGCGRDIDGYYTLDCKMCANRKAKRNERRREQLVESLFLTRAQAVGLYGTAMELPVDTTLEVTPGTNGVLIVTARSEQTDAQIGYHLLPEGGREKSYTRPISPPKKN